jgi:hypothetical protein
MLNAYICTQFGRNLSVCLCLYASFYPKGVEAFRYVFFNLINHSYTVGSSVKKFIISKFICNNVLCNKMYN